MGNTHAMDTTLKLTKPRGPLDYGPDLSRLHVRVTRELAQGHPVPKERLDQIIADIEITQDGAYRYLREVAERDADGNILGIMGFTLNDTAHRFNVNGTPMSAWCAVDTLFLPTMLGRIASVESVSPVSGEKIRLTVDPRAVKDLDPAGAVVSIPIFDPEDADMSSVEAIWDIYCHHSFFFASREEAEQWAADRNDIEIVSVEEAFELGRQLSSRLLAYGA